MRVGDIVVAVDGRPIDTFEELRNIISFKTPGDRLALTIERAGETLELRVQLSLPDGSTPPDWRPPDER